jgi:Flp pilus assembly protein TadG
MWQAVRSFLLADAGAALVELTLFAPLLIISSIVTMDFGLFFLHQMQAQNAVQAAVQFAMATGHLPPSSIDQFPITSSTGTFCPSTSSPYLTPDLPCPDGSVAGLYVQVWTEANYNPLVPSALFSNPYTVTAQGWVRVQ